MQNTFFIPGMIDRMKYITGLEMKIWSYKNGWGLGQVCSRHLGWWIDYKQEFQVATICNSLNLDQLSFKRQWSLVKLVENIMYELKNSIMALLEKHISEFNLIVIVWKHKEYL